MPRQSPLPAVLYPRQLFNLVLQLLSHSTESNGDQGLNQLNFAFKVTRECHFFGRNFRLPFRSNPYYVLHGVAPFFLCFFPISILLGATPIFQRSLALIRKRVTSSC